jgi:hypothetical protein
LTITDADVSPGGAVYAGELLLDGGLGQLPLVSTASPDLTIYYDPSRPANAYLAGQTYTLSGGGSIAPAPEPSGLALLAVGAYGIVIRRRRKRGAGG